MCPMQVIDRFRWVPITIFYETNSALLFERELSRGYRLNIAAGTATRFEPGQTRSVELVEYAGEKAVYGFNAQIMGRL